MNDEGHFTLEAVVGVAILSLLLLASQLIEREAIARQSRARGLLQETLALERIQSCHALLRTANYEQNPPASCRDIAPADGKRGNTSPLRSIDLSLPGRQAQDRITLLYLEFVE